MTVTVVLDGAGLQAWAAHVPPRQMLTVMEVLRRAGAGRVLVPSVVTVEALTGDARDAPVDRVIKQVDLDERLPLPRTRTAAALRQDTSASVVDAVVAETAIRTRADYLITSDPDDMITLLDKNGGRTVVVRV
jgi:predicted nucleic acid-binding protein